MSNNIKAVLKTATKDLITEETLTQIETLFNESIDKKVTEKSQLQVEAALTQQDEKHTAQLKVLLEKIDADHSAKLEKVVQAITESHTAKLKTVIKKYQASLSGEANTFKESLINTISNYLDLYLEKAVPLEHIQEAVKVKKSIKLIAEMRRMLGVDLAFSQDVIKEGVADGKQRLILAEKEKQDLLTETTAAKDRAEKAESLLLLESLTKGLPSEKKEYAIKVLGNKGQEFIKENFDYTMGLFEKEQETILEDLRKDAKPVTKKIDRPVKEKEQVINESAEVDSQISPYMKELSKY